MTTTVAKIGGLVWPLLALWPARELASPLVQAWAPSFGIDGGQAALAARAAAPALFVFISAALYWAFLVERGAVIVAAAAGGLSAVWSLAENFLYIRAAVPELPLALLVERMSPGVLWGAGGAFVAVGLGRQVARARPRQFAPTVQRSTSNLHDNEDWMPIEDAKALFGSGGIILGEAYRVDRSSVADVPFDRLNPKTWGPGGKAPLLRYDGEAGSGHILLVAGSGGYKTAAVGIPTALEWSGALVYLDPAREVCNMVARTRGAGGRQFARLDPRAPDTATFNPLAWIDTTSDLSLLEIRNVIGWLFGEHRNESANAIFESQGKALAGCLLAEILFDPDLAPDQKTLAVLRQRITLPTEALKSRLEAIYSLGPDFGFGLPHQLAGALKDVHHETFSGFHIHASDATEWLSTPSLARLVSEPGFTLADLQGGKLDVFLNLEEQILKEYPGLARLIVGALLNGVHAARGTMPARVLFVLDEVHQLGYMRHLETARDTMRKFGVNLLMMYQSLGQLEKTWGREGVSAWFDSTYVKMFACLGDQQSLELLSKMCGGFTAVARSINEGASEQYRREELVGSVSTSGGQSQQEVARRLATEREIARMRDDEQIILVKGRSPLRCGRAIYFRRPEMKARVAKSDFVRA